MIITPQGARQKREPESPDDPEFQPLSTEITVGKDDLPKPIVVFPRNELANADRLVHYFGDYIRYCYPWKRWLVWTGSHWLEDRSGEVNRMAERVVRSILLEAGSELCDDPKKQAMWFFDSAKARQVRNMMELAQAKRPILPDQLDQNPNLLNCLNGTIDLTTGELLPHDPEHYITKCLPINFDDEAKCDAWKEFLHSIMGGDDELVSYIQRATGYSLTGDTREQVMFILWGTGANGKSTFLKILQDLLGPYAMQVDPKTLISKQRDKIANDIARLRGARFVAASETDEGQNLSEAKVKQMTGQDKLIGEFKFQEQFEFMPTFKVWLATNHLPKVEKNDHAIWRRLPLIKFGVTYWDPDKGENAGAPEHRMDKSLPARLEEELPGILAWAVSGALYWRSKGLCPPDAVRQATAEYRAEQDTLLGFMADECIVNDTAKCLMQDLYKAYERWCKDNNENPMTKRAFGSRLDERDITAHKGAGNRTYRVGIGLLVEPKQAELPNDNEEKEQSNPEPAPQAPPKQVEIGYGND